MTLRAGIVGSSGGSALRAAVDCLRVAGVQPDLTVVTDRACGLEQWALAEGFPAVRIAYSDARQFSQESLSVFHEAGVTDVLLYYTRRVAPPLISACTVHNIHPSLLPAFPGLHGVRDALEAGVRILGATLHEVDDALDTGPVLSQIACALQGDESLALAERLSYVQKVYLSLVWFDQLATGAPCDAHKVGNLEVAAVTSASAGLSNARVMHAFLLWAREVEQSALLPSPPARNLPTPLVLAQ